MNETQIQIERTNTALEALRAKAVEEKRTRLQALRDEAQKEARKFRDQATKLKGDFFRLQDVAARHDEACAKIEAQLITLAQTVAKEDFPLPAETERWDAERLRLETALNAARQRRAQAKDARECARDEALRSDAVYVRFAQEAQNIKNQLVALAEGGKQGGVFRV